MWDEYQCKEKAKYQELEYHWGLPEGCMVKDKEGKWIDYDRYRIMELKRKAPNPGAFFYWDALMTQNKTKAIGKNNLANCRLLSHHLTVVSLFVSPCKSEGLKREQKSL